MVKYYRSEFIENILRRKTATSAAGSISLARPVSSREEKMEVSSSLNLVFSALSSPVRRAMLDRLSKGESSVTELAEPFDMSLPAISKHLKILEEARLITKVKEGRTFHCRLDLLALAKAAEWVNFYRGLWERQLDEFSKYLQKSERAES
jgi:DNA-binding transcriptional ArsR family regulator